MSHSSRSRFVPGSSASLLGAIALLGAALAASPARAGVTTGDEPAPPSWASEVPSLPAEYLVEASRTPRLKSIRCSSSREELRARRERLDAIAAEVKRASDRRESELWPLLVADSRGSGLSGESHDRLERLRDEASRLRRVYFDVIDDSIQVGFQIADLTLAEAMPGGSSARRLERAGCAELAAKPRSSASPEVAGERVSKLDARGVSAAAVGGDRVPSGLARASR